MNVAKRYLIPFVTLLCLLVLPTGTSTALAPSTVFAGSGDDSAHNEFTNVELLPQRAASSASSRHVRRGDSSSTVSDSSSTTTIERRRRELKSSSSSSTHVNVWQKFKESLGLFIVGIILIVCSPVFMWKNEGRHVVALKKIDYAKNKATMVDCQSPSPEENGQLVHFIGNVTTDSPLSFSEGGMNISSPLPGALILKRSCYIYQKFEDAHQSTQSDTIGGGETRTTTYTLREDWATSPQPDCENLEETNESGLWSGIVEVCGGEASSVVVSADAHVGGFALSREIIGEYPMVFQMDTAPLAEDYIPDEVEGLDGLMNFNNQLQTYSPDETPKNGDVKVVYEYVPEGFDCTFVVCQAAAGTTDDKDKYGVTKCNVVDESCCGACEDDIGEIWMVKRGSHTLEEMVDMAKEEENMMVKILRVVCFVALLAGWIMLFSPLTTILSTLPILKQLGYFAVVLVGLIFTGVCFCSVTAVAYLRYRPILAFAILAIAAIITGIVIWRLDVAAKNTPPATNATHFVPYFLPSDMVIVD